MKRHARSVPPRVKSAHRLEKIIIHASVTLR
jgi:hypothetical protein